MKGLVYQMSLVQLIFNLLITIFETADVLDRKVFASRLLVFLFRALKVLFFLVFGRVMDCLGAY